MKNIWPEEYMHNPNINKPIEQIWDDMDAYSFEERYENDLKNKLTLVIPFPPMFYKGKFLKGIFYSNATRTIIRKLPELKELFFVCANSMFASSP